jgi:type VI secretion system secreted protein VgrG
MRVGTSWAGHEWGAIRIPRIGHEVIVDFLEGDPDQPIIVGSVYNAEMMPPYELPKNKTQSGVKSRSSLKGGPKNYNEFRFEDKKGKELVNLHAERNLATTVENDESRGVGHDRATEIGHDDTLHVKNDETISIDHDRTEVVGNDEKVLIKGNRLHNVKKDDGLVVGGDRGRKVIIEKGDDILQIDQGNQEVWIKQGDRVVKIDQGSDRLIVGKGDRTIAAPLGEVNISAKKL